MSAPHLPSLTVLMSRDGTASKRIEMLEDGSVEIKDFNAGTYFSFSTHALGDILDLAAALEELGRQPRMLVIRGVPVQGLDPDGFQQRLNINFETPAVGQRWLMVDVDKIARPATLRAPLDAAATREYVISLLPKEFHDATYYWQLSSSAGFKDPSKISIHLWFWLDRPIPDAELKRWAKHVNNAAGYKLVDPALFQHVQAHYTAAPVFDGVADPFPTRSGLERKDKDDVSIELPQVTSVKRAAKRSGIKLEPAVGFEGWLARIGDHKGGDGFHEPIIRAAASYVATNGVDGTDIEALYERIRETVLTADRTGHDNAYVDHMASREHIVAAIEGAITKFGEGGNARRKAKRVDGVPPYYPTESVPAASAFESLAVEIDRVFQAR